MHVHKCVQIQKIRVRDIHRTVTLKIRLVIWLCVCVAAPLDICRYGYGHAHSPYSMYVHPASTYLYSDVLFEWKWEWK